MSKSRLSLRKVCVSLSVIVLFLFVAYPVWGSGFYEIEDRMVLGKYDLGEDRVLDLFATGEDMKLILELNSGGNEVWSIDSPSEWIIVDKKSELIFITGKEFGEGYFSMEKAFFEDFMIYNLDGGKIGEVDTGLIRQIEIMDNGEILILTFDSIIKLDGEGSVLLEEDSEGESIVVDGDSFVVVDNKIKPYGSNLKIYDESGLVNEFFEEGPYSGPDLAERYSGGVKK